MGLVLNLRVFQTILFGTISSVQHYSYAQTAGTPKVHVRVPCWLLAGQWKSIANQRKLLYIWKQRRGNLRG